KVKELAEIFKVSPAELLKILPNVGVDVSLKEETMIDKDVEKKLAKRYNVPYPFKKAAPKPKPVEAPHVAQKPTVEEKPKPRVTPKPATEIPKKPVETPHVVKKPIVEEIIQPRVDEETLEKYQEFLEDDEYNITRENKGRGRRQTQGEENQTPHSKKKNNNKNKQSKNKERRTSNIPTKEDKEDNVLYYENGMTVMEIAEAMHLSVTELVKKLFVSMGILANATQSLDRDTAELVAMEYNYELKDKQITDLTRFDEMTFDDDDEKDLVSRPAIVTIMGHVDHGKTTLLDTIRSSHVVSGEAGGITQHIGAYQVEKNGKLITFIDTPGHAAFTEMRARGAQITDIVVLVVAADDGVMPQTKEAIEHAQAANVPIIVAINKMDKPGVNPDRIKQELTEYGLLAEEWGGDTIFVPISALTGKGVDELLEMIILVSEMKDYKANPNRLGTGTVIEAKLDKGKGPVATLLVQNGTIKIGDIVVVGNTYGKIRAMQNELGQPIKSAGPSKPVEITGIMEVPFAGEKFVVINDERKAKTIAETRAFNKFSQEKNGAKAASLTDIFKGEDDGSIKTLNLIIKCDVQGSIEAIKGLLDKIKIEGTRINIVGARVGGITDNDISLAIASNAIIIGFNIRPLAQITDLAKEKGVEIRLYNIIYKLQEDIENAVKGMLDPVYEEKESGQAEVRETFKVSKVGTIAGCYVLSGSFVRNGGVRVVRDSIVVYTGKIGSLKRFKDDVKEVKAGYECGITIENFNDIKVGDILECFVMEEKERE
ncbi:MAG: translation initiation factor IF-2, partial [Bacilli bacterium]|nr:translation initiation factor IF-2 [Bacilli bacterium]